MRLYLIKLSLGTALALGSATPAAADKGAVPAPSVPAAAKAATRCTVTDARLPEISGLVVVGNLVETGEAQEHGIVGETPNLAARLQVIAEPNITVQRTP